MRHILENFQKSIDKNITLWENYNADNGGFMGNRRTVVVTAYGHKKTIDKIAVSTFRSTERSHYTNQGSDAETYCDTINSLELKDDSWVFAKIFSENIQYSVKEFFPLIFSDAIIKLDNMTIQKVLIETDAQELAKSLKNQDEIVKEKIYANMSKRASQMLKEDMDYMGPIRLIDIKQSQEKILNIIRRLDPDVAILIP
jgi:flagellar motor switch protein FliG